MIKLYVGNRNKNKVIITCFSFRQENYPEKQAKQSLTCDKASIIIAMCDLYLINDTQYNLISTIFSIGILSNNVQ